MQRKGARRTRGGEGVDAVLDELYTTPPSGFVSHREELAAAAKEAGRVEDAGRIHAARRPTLAAWAANLLLRSRPKESRQFLELGRALREAYGTLDTAGVKELSAQRRSVVSAMSRQAAQLAREAGQRLSDAVLQDVEATLRAVLADQEAADHWATGRLHSALTPPSAFPSDTGPATAVPRKPTRPTAPKTAGRPQNNELAERRRVRQAQLAQATKAAKEAERQLRAKRAAHADADTLLRRARDQHDRARQQVDAVEHQLHQAHEDLRRTEQDQRAAEERRKTTADALAQAEQEARTASREVARLTARVR
ncbi:hypothetical protein GR925_18350 [Streptomyces sp. HUCO-GS316]|uniref:hypothetical protein n=1 Tax=Streptomyces sp. HUCO-GS316 TaxID=2692198 RepID=UPI00136E18F6|nr:hypothetical protein [Streptomyces sp. HUCO-GS316]MXM65355.1 hypothetical protein [Streptomyces sp. HUCO-GS316]